MEKETTSQDFTLPMLVGLTQQPKYQELLDARWNPIGATVRRGRDARYVTVRFEREKRLEA